jgi:transposase InsO family protein
VISALATQYPVRSVCRVLEVTRSGYYQWRGKVAGPRAQANQQLLEQIRQVFDKNRQTYGSPRVTRQLRHQQIACSENRVARLMRCHNIRAKSKRPFRPRTTDSQPLYGAAPNRLAGAGPLTRVNQTWVADITYVKTAGGWVYLAAVMDLYSRKIVGWSLGYTLQTSLVKEALEQALAMRRPAVGLLHHSDRGVQYASSAFQALLLTHQILPSMSSRGNCYDNANIESFWSTLKTELIHRQSFHDLPQARSAIFEYIEIFYNRQRLHSALGYKTPVEYEQNSTWNQKPQSL